MVKRLSKTKGAALDNKAKKRKKKQLNVDDLGDDAFDWGQADEDAELKQAPESPAESEDEHVVRS